VLVSVIPIALEILRTRRAARNPEQPKNPENPRLAKTPE
jgi:hypothetical protein